VTTRAREAAAEAFAALENPAAAAIGSARNLNGVSGRNPG
jgi:hypothetical protein